MAGSDTISRATIIIEGLASAQHKRELADQMMRSARDTRRYADSLELASTAPILKIVNAARLITGRPAPRQAIDRIEVDEIERVFRVHYSDPKGPIRVPFALLDMPINEAVEAIRADHNRRRIIHADRTATGLRQMSEDFSRMAKRGNP